MKNLCKQGKSVNCREIGEVNPEDARCPRRVEQHALTHINTHCIHWEMPNRC